MHVRRSRIRPPTSPARRARGRHAGFTLLELVAAFTILAVTILPLLEIVHQARLSSTQYTIRREVQELAQRKLFDRIYSYSEELIDAGSMEALEGTFEDEGHPDWRWEIPYPELVSQGEQVLLEYRIFVFTPHGDLGGSGSSGGGSMGASSASIQDSTDLLSMIRQSAASSSHYGADWGGEQPSFEMSTWVLPSISWYLEQQALAEQGLDTGYGGMSGMLGGMGALGGMGGF